MTDGMLDGMKSCETSCPELRRFRVRIEEDEAAVEVLRAAGVHFQRVGTMNEIDPDEGDQGYEGHSGHYQQFVSNVTEAFITLCDSQVEALLKRIERNREGLGSLGVKQCLGPHLAEAPDGAEMWVCGMESEQ